MYTRIFATLLGLVCCVAVDAATVYTYTDPGTIYDPPQTQVSVTQAQVHTTPARVVAGPSGVQVIPARTVYVAPQVTVSSIDQRRSSNHQQVVNHTTYTWNASQTTRTVHQVQPVTVQHSHHRRRAPQQRTTQHQRATCQSTRHSHQQVAQQQYRQGYRDGYRDGQQDSAAVISIRGGLPIIVRPRASITFSVGR